MRGNDLHVSPVQGPGTLKQHKSMALIDRKVSHGLLRKAIAASDDGW